MQTTKGFSVAQICHHHHRTTTTTIDLMITRGITVVCERNG
jgi:hypothetical protein